MLRRPPTTITLTASDLATYDATHPPQHQLPHHLDPNPLFPDDPLNKRGAWPDNKTSPAAVQQAAAAKREREVLDPNDELKPLPGERTRGGRASGALEGRARDAEAGVEGRVERERERAERIQGRRG